MPSRFCLLALALFPLVPRIAAPAEAEVLRDIRVVQATGGGSVRARAAWDRLVERGPAELPALLAAMDTPDVVVANWLRLALDEIVARERKAGGKKIDVDALLAYARDAKRQGRPRRLALDLAEELRPGVREKLLPGWIDDPTFREDALDALLARLKPDKDLPNPEALEALRKGFRASRSPEQAYAFAALLKRHGEAVSVADHMGFLREWHLVGPFDAGGGKGFTTTYAPEKKVDLDATLEGKGGKKLRWTRVSVAETAGRIPALVDLRKPLGDANDAVAFAWTSFTVPSARAVEFRGAADDNLTVWVNGERVFGFEEYQNGVRLDRHRFPVKLRAGVNTVLVKVCQAPASPGGPPNWEFLLRITDSDGRGLKFPPALKAR